MGPAPILAALLALAPPSRATPPPGWAETDAAARARYASIADDIAATARTRSEAAALVGIAWHESRYAADVDAGRCYRGPGWESRCDGGRAVSLWQLQGRDEERAVWARDRRAAAHEALRRILQSRAACRHNEHALRLAAFASGSCDRGLTAARRLDAAVRRALVLLP